MIKVKSIKLSTTKKTLEIGGKKKDAKFTDSGKKDFTEKSDDQEDEIHFFQ